jgi:hypothetical protein
MAARRTVLTGIAAAAGCIGPGNPGRAADQNGENGPTDTRSDAAEGDTADESYHLRAAPVGIPDREPVLSADDDAVAGIDPLVDLLETVANTLEVTYASLSPSNAEAFEELTAGVEQYHAGNPPGYYIDYRGLVISVSHSG